MCRTGGPRCSGSKKASEPTEREQAVAEMFGTAHTVAEPPADTLFTVPGTGSDWMNAQCPEGLVPVPPATTKMRPWNKIGARQVPTDREQLAYYDAMSQGETTGSTVHAQLAAESIRRRAAAGHHDGSLPELGDYKPTHFTYKEDQK